MNQHKYHRFFLPILQKLYLDKDSDNYIEINDCLNGTDDQNDNIIYHLVQSEFAIIQDDSICDLTGRIPYERKFSAKILPLGIDYFETIVQEFIQANKKKPPVGFKTKTKE